MRVVWEEACYKEVRRMQGGGLQGVLGPTYLLPRRRGRGLLNHMPLYDYKCGKGHTTTLIRSYEKRVELPRCKTCGGKTTYQFPLVHAMPDGMYSYAPNLGSAANFEKRQAAMADSAYARKHKVAKTTLRNRAGDDI